MVPPPETDYGRSDRCPGPFLPIYRIDHVLVNVKGGSRVGSPGPLSFLRMSTPGLERAVIIQA
jgi:hypothetical protein